MGWTLLRHAMLPVGGPQELRVYPLPGPGSSDSVRDVTELVFRVWAPGRDAASVQHLLNEGGSGAINVEQLCEAPGIAEVTIPLVLALTLGILGLVTVVTGWHRFKPRAS